MDIGRLPDYPAPTQVEIELTNLCNARCIACPRADMPVGGFMREDTLTGICELYKDYRHPTDGLPIRVIVAGGGEPLLHPSADRLAATIRSYGFHVTLITNASRLDRIDARNLIENVDQVLVSFWGVEPEEYMRSMKLDYRTSLRNVETLKKLCDRRGVGLAIQWLDHVHMRSTPQEIVSFWQERGIDDLRCGAIVWNRGGLVQPNLNKPGNDLAGTPDFSLPIWCADIFFSDAWTWAGDLTLCCCTFFHRDHHSFGNIANLSRQAIERAKAAFLQDVRLEACEKCTAPRRTRAHRLSERFFDRLSDEDRARFSYEP